MKIKNKIFVIIALFFVIISLSGLISAEEINYSYSYIYEGVQITLLTYEPYPVNPGEYFDVWIQASLGNNADYVKFEMLDSFPFTIDNGEDAMRIYEEADSRDVVMHYKVRVDEDAVEGVNELNLKIMTSKVSNEGVVKGFEIYVDDAQTDFDLVVQDSSDSEISLAIANIGKNTANSMIVRIPEQDSYKATGTSGQMVGNLDSGDYTIVSFEVTQISRDSEDPLKVQIDYTDSIGERRSITKEIDFGSGVVMGNFSMEEMPEGFEAGNFPGQRKSSTWPYLLVASLIILIAGFFIYRKNSNKIKTFLKSKFPKKESKKINDKVNVPEWMIKESKNIKKR